MLESVLVLNANYEPINICNMRRAVGLILTERASLVVNGRGEINTANSTFPRPSIIRLDHMIHRPRPKIQLTRREIFRRDNYTCQYCGKQSRYQTIDHVIPRHLGGMHIWTNVVTACASCNHYKGGRTLQESGLRLMQIPQEPSSSLAYIFSRGAPEYEEWEPYLKGW